MAKEPQFKRKSTSSETPMTCLKPRVATENWLVFWLGLHSWDSSLELHHHVQNPKHRPKHRWNVLCLVLGHSVACFFVVGSPRNGWASEDSSCLFAFGIFGGLVSPLLVTGEGILRRIRIKGPSYRFGSFVFGAVLSHSFAKPPCA